MSTVDGYPRGRVAEKRLNEAVAVVLSTEPGQIMLTWLREISVEAVLDDTLGDRALWKQEGMRHLTKLIEKRGKVGSNERASPGPDTGS